jgi:uncharacterized protein YerC
MSGLYRPRADVAELLRQGATYAHINEQLGASSNTISATRKAYGIPLPTGPGRRLSPGDRERIEEQAAKMLLEGATLAQIRAAIGISAPTITRIRRERGIPKPVRPPRQPARTVAVTLALYGEAYGDGHLRWTGPHAGRMPTLSAEGRHFNARHVTFRQHHGRNPVGYVLTDCSEPGCMAGGHLTDFLIRSGHAPSPAAVVTGGAA